MNTWFFRVQALTLVLMLALIPATVWISCATHLIKPSVSPYDLTMLALVIVLLLTLLGAYIGYGEYHPDFGAAALTTAASCLFGVMTAGLTMNNMWVGGLVTLLASAAVNAAVVDDYHGSAVSRAVKEFERWCFCVLPTVVAVFIMYHSVLAVADGRWLVPVGTFLLASLIWSVWGLDLDRRLHIVHLAKNQRPA